MSDFSKKVISGFAWEAITKLLMQVVSWVSTIWVARLLTPEDYGLVAISGIFTGLCLTFSVMGLTNALINKEVLHEYDKANVFWASALLAVAVYLLLYFLAPVISYYYETDELTDIIRVAGAMVIISPLSVVPRAILMRELEFKSLALVNMFSALAGTVLTLAFALMGWGYWSLILATVAAQALELVALFCVTIYVPSRPKNIRTLFPMYKYGINILGARLIAYLNVSWPVIMVSSYFGKTPTGHFQMANTLAGLPMTKIGEIFTKIAFPAFSKIQNDIERTKQVFLAMHCYLFMVVAPMFTGIALTASEFIPILIGEKWLEIVLPLQVICVANIFAGSAMIIPRVFEGLGDANSSFKYQLLITIMSPIALFLGSPWGVVGMLIGWAFVMPISYIYLLNVLFKKINLSLREFINSIYATCLSLLIMILAINSIEVITTSSDPGWLLFYKVAIGIASYSLAYFLFGKKELKQLLSLLRSRGAAS